ncbi:MAG: RNA polymerase sigma factor [Saprospiraceae bacterium]|nr:RNA polymerase sigma factor [Saprospiraceae bacterium]
MGSKQIDDHDILQWMKDLQTNEKGLRALMQKYQERLYWHIRRMVLNHDDADDILQNTFIKVYRSINQFEGKSSLFTWLYRIATNETLTFLEKSKKWKVDSMDESQEHPSITNLRSDEYFDGDQLSLNLEAAVVSLPPKQRQVFQLRYYDEMSYQDISQVLETSEGALKASYHHAVKKIEEYLKSRME